VDVGTFEEGNDAGGGKPVVSCLSWGNTRLCLGQDVEMGTVGSGCTNTGLEDSRYDVCPHDDPPEALVLQLALWGAGDDPTSPVIVRDRQQYEMDQHTSGKGNVGRKDKPWSWEKRCLQGTPDRDSDWKLLFLLFAFTQIVHGRSHSRMCPGTRNGQG
jgi:hypothetical protein